MKRMRIGRLLAGVAVAGLLTACQTVREQEDAVKPEVAREYLADKPEALRRHFYVTLAQGKRNQVLNDMRLGLATFAMGNNKLAAELFDDALSNIETIYANNENAAKARELFQKELTKDFKGEPYERAMAYYYRGLLYLKEGDYDNARASFKGGLIQDAFADEDQSRPDFGLLAFLQGWASRCRGNTVTAEDDFKQFREINPSFPLPAPDDNLLVLVETGSAPVKFSVADTKSDKPRFLKFNRHSVTEQAQVRLSETFQPPPVKGAKGKSITPPAETKEKVVPAPMLENIYFQASTRGGRAFDSVLQGKAQFKQGADLVGNVAAVGAGVAAVRAANTGRREDAYAAGALALVAIAAKAAASATEPEADTRYWDNLPDRIHGVTVRVPASASSVTVDILAPDGMLLRSADASISRAGACGLAWLRGKPAYPNSVRAPNSAPPEVMPRPVIIPSAANPVPPLAPAGNPVIPTEPASGSGKTDATN